MDAALDAKDNLYYIGIAFEKALQELDIFLPKSINKCLWLLLQYYISQIVDGKVHPDKSLSNIMDVYYGCNLYDKNNHYVGDSHDIHYFIGYY